MLEEHQLIPYEPSDIPPGPWLVFAPHPDDETFGMGGSIALASRQNIRVEVVVMTAGDQGGDPEIRRLECQCAGEILGAGKFHFWNIPDRGINRAAVSREDLQTIIGSLQPETVFLPGIQEYHPDHRAATQVIRPLLDSVGYKKNIWFYEISRHNEANRLVDITTVMELKLRAINCFASQRHHNDYDRTILALNVSRAYTLPRETTHAEAFWSGSSAPDAFNTLSSQQNALYRYQNYLSAHDSPLVSVVVRTKDRPMLLQEALDSIFRQTYRPVEIVVVNDGGKTLPVEVVNTSIPDVFFRYVEHKKSLGRAEAANSGIREATGSLICFLDDDDLFYPCALQSLVSMAGKDRIVHARARCAFYDSSGEADPTSTIVLGEPADSGRLILENYIAFNTICVPRNVLINVGPLDSTLEIYEDWDLLIRLSREYKMLFIDALVSEYRIFGTATLTGKGGSEMQDIYKQKVLSKHLEYVSAGDILRFVQSSVDRAVLNKEKTINHLSDKIKEKDFQLSSLEETLAARYKHIQGLEEEMQKIREELHLQKNFCADMEAQLQGVYSSTSWKITRPLRVLKKLIRFNK